MPDNRLPYPVAETKRIIQDMPVPLWENMPKQGVYVYMFDTNRASCRGVLSYSLSEGGVRDLVVSDIEIYKNGDGGMIYRDSSLPGLLGTIPCSDCEGNPYTFTSFWRYVETSPLDDIS